MYATDAIYARANGASSGPDEIVAYPRGSRLPFPITPQRSTMSSSMTATVFDALAHSCWDACLGSWHSIKSMSSIEAPPTA